MVANCESSIQEVTKSPSKTDYADISVVILHWNSVYELASCLKRLSWCNDIHIVTSLDSTGLEVLKAASANFHQCDSVDFQERSDWFRSNIKVRCPWQLHIYADEYIHPDLVSELVGSTGLEKPMIAHCTYSLRHHFELFNRKLRFAMPPRPTKKRFFRTTGSMANDATAPDSNEHGLNSDTLLYPLVTHVTADGLADVFRQMNAKSNQMAVSHQGQGPSHQPFVILSVLTTFIKFYLLRCGFVDGLAGFYLSINQAMSVYWTELKIMEQNRNWHDANDQLAARLLEEAERAQRSD